MNWKKKFEEVEVGDTVKFVKCTTGHLDDLEINIGDLGEVIEICESYIMVNGINECKIKRYIIYPNEYEKVV